MARMHKNRIVLGIESSCDETSVSIVREKTEYEQETPETEDPK